MPVCVWGGGGGRGGGEGGGGVGGRGGGLKLYRYVFVMNNICTMIQSNEHTHSQNKKQLRIMKAVNFIQ